MRCSHVFSLLASFALFLGSSPAAILEYRAEFGTPIYSFDSQDGRGTTAFQVTGPKPTLTGTLNAGDQFRFVYSAPDGQLFSILPKPSGSTFSGFFVNWWSEFNVGLPRETPGTSISFVGASGPAPVPLSFDLSDGEFSHIRGLATFEVENFSFKSIAVTFTIPQGYSRTFTNFTPNLVSLTAFSLNATDPGPSAVLIPQVPEPASILLVPGSLALLALRNRRFRQICRHPVTRSN